jgi:hypothetical protein
MRSPLIPPTPSLSEPVNSMIFDGSIRGIADQLERAENYLESCYFTVKYGRFPAIGLGLEKIRADRKELFGVK